MVDVETLYDPNAPIVRTVETITWVRLCLDFWVYFHSDPYPSEDTSVYTVKDYAHDMYEIAGVQFAVEYIERGE